MIELTIVLFQRIGLLLLMAFILTRIPRFRSLLDKDITLRTVIHHSLIFGLISIIGAHAGVVMIGDELIMQAWIMNVAEDEVLIGFSIVVVMIAGLLGGPFVGLGSGMVAGLYIIFLGGGGWIANSLINPLAGLLTGWAGQFFSDDRVMSPNKALFIGIFPPVLHMGLLLIMLPDQQIGVQIVNTIGIPLVVTNSIALTIFTMMIRLALNETEQEAALETNRALTIAEKALPLLSEVPGTMNAGKMAKLLFHELDIAAISITNRTTVLSHVGLGDDHHRPGEPLKMRLSRKAVKDGKIQIAYNQSDIQCGVDNCKLKTAIMVPIYRSGEVIGLINLYYRHSQQITAVEITLAKGLGTIISNQISGLEAEKMKKLLKEAEMRNLQAQINPHFLFNTFHLIHSLLRVNAEKARHILLQLSQFMRANLKIASESLVPLHKELEHLQAYLEIVQARFPDQITTSIHVDDHLLNIEIPPATLQPLVENSIQHGLSLATTKGLLTINIRKAVNNVSIELLDNGKGFEESLLPLLGKEPIHQHENNGNGIALYNINQRLTSLLGEESELRIQNTDHGSMVQFKLPNRDCKKGEQIHMSM